MELTESKKLSEAKVLYRTAFPKEERLPWWVLRLTTCLDGVELTAYRNQDGFCGFTHTTATADTLYIMFFAVKESLHSKGYGSAILELLKRNHADKAIILNVEPLDDQAENAGQRARRMRFYEKNNFIDTGYNSTEVGGVFRVLSTRSELDTEAYLKVFHKLSFGFWQPKITKEK